MSKIENGINYFGVNLNGSPSQYVLKTIDIGDWDMNSYLSTTVSHSLSSTELKTIKNLNVLVRDDADSKYYPIVSNGVEVYENRFGPTNNLNIFNWGLNNTSQTLDKNYNIYFPQTASTANDFYVNDSYSLSAYNGFNFSFVIPNNTDTYTINLNLFLNLQMYHTQTGVSVFRDPNLSTNIDLLCDIILKQGSTIKNTVTYNLGDLPGSLNGSASPNDFFISYTDTISSSLNSTDQLYFNIRFYSSGNYQYYYIVPSGPGAGTRIDVSTNYDIYTLSTSASTQSYFANYNGQNSIISTSFFKLKANTFFKTTDFNSTSYNRGYITFLYKPD